jgi:hypothetical protein
MTSARTILCALLGCASLQLSATAHACSQPCPVPIQLPRGTQLPGNLIYFKVLVDDPGELALHTAAGEPIAASIRTIGNDRIFAPEAPVAEGTELVLEYESQCPLPPASPSSFSFLVSAPGAPELRPAALEIAERGTSHPIGEGETSFVRLAYYGPDVSGISYPIITDRFTVDGLPARLRLVDSQELIEVPVQCQPGARDLQLDTCGTVVRVAPGVHTVQAQSTILGQLTQPDPVSLQVEVTCPDAAVSSPDPGVPPACEEDGSSDVEPPSAPDASDPYMRTDPPLADLRGEHADTGCALQPRSTRNSTGLGASLLGAALLALAASARRQVRGRRAMRG